MTFSSCLQLWLWLSAFATLAGWTLSAAGELNRSGYFVAFILFAIFIFTVRKKFGCAIHFSLAAKTLRRFRRPLPFCFASLSLLIFISGLIYAPDNYTGLTYRTGRVLQWLSHDHWIWVHTTDFRMNDRACGMEWLMAPIILFTHSTRALFLLNFLPFLLLPGLIFSFFIRLGVHPRVAWQWMWLLPTGYDFLLQAGSIANDTFPAVYALAAADYALRTAKSKKTSDLAHSILAAALLTGAKASNLPLLLPCAVLMIPLLPVLRKNVVAVVFVSLLAAVVSFLPTALLNIHYLGDWSGLSIEDAGMNMKNPFVGLWGNPFIFLLDNFTPPLFPLAEWWNHHASTLLPHFMSAPIGNNFQEGSLALGEVPTEDWTGIGLGLSVLLAVSLGSNFFVSQTSTSRRQLTPFQWFVLVTPWLALLAYCSKSGMNTGARLIAPYYPLVLPLLLVGWAAPKIIRTRWWRILVYASLFLALIVLVLTPDRPLWPAKNILSGLVAKHPGSHALARAFDVYSVYAKRPDPLADVRALVPPSVEKVGFIGAPDDCDFSLWLPLGSRQVEHFLVTDPPERFQRLNVQYVVLGGLNLRYHQMTIDDWLNKNGAQLVATTNAIQKVAEGSQPWYLVRLPRAGAE
jgi:hypothetical protein